MLCKCNKKRGEGSSTARKLERELALHSAVRLQGCLLCTSDPFISLGSNGVRAAVLPPSLPGPAGAAPQPGERVHVYRKSFSLPFLSLLRLLAKLFDSYLVSAEP